MHRATFQLVCNCRGQSIFCAASLQTNLNVCYLQLNPWLKTCIRLGQMWQMKTSEDEPVGSLLESVPTWNCFPKTAAHHHR